MCTWIIGATGDKLSWVWYIIVMGFISLLGTLAVRVPSGWTSHSGSDVGLGAIPAEAAD